MKFDFGPMALHERSWAPIRLLTWVLAHLPKAAEAPVRLSNATITPRMTRKMNTPAVSFTVWISPSLTMMSMIGSGAKLPAKQPPSNMPMKSEE